MKEFDYSQVKHYKLYNFIKTIFRPLVKFVFKMQFKGLENIPSEAWLRDSDLAAPAVLHDNVAHVCTV